MMASPRLEEFRRHLMPRLTRGVLGATHATERTMLPRTGIHRILICRTVHTLGDSLMLTPLLDELANIYPGAEMDIISGYTRLVSCIACVRQRHLGICAEPDPLLLTCMPYFKRHHFEPVGEIVRYRPPVSYKL